MARTPLRRSPSERMIAGIAGGIAERSGWDPVLVRIAFVLVALVTSGVGVVAYAVAWALVPEREDASGTAEGRTVGQGRLWGGVVLLGLGGLMLLDLLDLDRGPARAAWPLALIAAGTALLVTRRRHDETPVGIDPASNRETPGPSGAADGGGADVPASDVRASDDATSKLTTSAYASHTAWPGAEPGTAIAVASDASAGQRRRFGRVAWGLILLYFGGVALVDATTDVDLDVVAVLAGSLALSGALLVLSAWFGRARGVIAFGFVLALLIGGLSLLHVPLRGGIGERVIRPTAQAQLLPRYELAIGALELDLTRLDFDELGPGDRVELSVTNAIGELRVIVPDDIAVEVRARVGAGELDLFGSVTEDGTNLDRRTEQRSATADAPVLVLDAEVGLGVIVLETADDADGVLA
jgi:phage shock protein PspC (stress-responsive transcriptional regulator)